VSIELQGRQIEDMVVMSGVDGSNMPKRSYHLWRPNNDLERAAGALGDFVAVHIGINILGRFVCSRIRATKDNYEHLEDTR
jgi:hypothetical protein